MTADLVTTPRRLAEAFDIAEARAALRGKTIRRRPLIGINCDLVVSPFSQRTLAWLDVGYVRCLQAAGAEVVILPPGQDFPGNLPLAGLVLVGGGDLDPERDGYQRHRSYRPMHPQREVTDRGLAASVRDSRLPVLGIGAGMQVLAVACGGLLGYHIPVDRPKTLVSHELRGDWEHGHAIYCRERSLMAYIYDSSVGHVRSQHHQFVEQVPDGFVATAWADGDLVEAIESIDTDWPAIGVQWHPEFSTALELDRTLFRHFVEIASQWG